MPDISPNIQSYNISEKSTRPQCPACSIFQIFNISEKSTRPQCPTFSNMRLTRSSSPPLWRKLRPLEAISFSSLQRGTGQHKDNDKEKDVAKETDTLPQSRLHSKANPLEAMIDHRVWQSQVTHKSTSPPSTLASHSSTTQRSAPLSACAWYKSSLSAFISLSSSSSSPYPLAPGMNEFSLLSRHH